MVCEINAVHSSPESSISCTISSGFDSRINIATNTFGSWKTLKTFVNDYASPFEIYMHKLQAYPKYFRYSLYFIFCSLLKESFICTVGAPEG